MDEKKKKRVLWSLQELDQISLGRYLSKEVKGRTARAVERATIETSLTLIAKLLGVKFRPLPW